MPAYDEELFGPVASVMIVPDEKTAIAVANDTNTVLALPFTRPIRSAAVVSPTRSMQAWFTSIIRCGFMKTCLLAGSRNPVTAANGAARH